MRREKWLAKIVSKDLIERKLERTRMKIVLSASPSLVFSHKVHNIRFEKEPLHWFFHTNFTISDLKSKYVFYPNYR